MRSTVIIGWVCLACACTGGQERTNDVASVVTIRHPDLRETSGLAHSLRHDDRLWAHNDSGGAAMLHAFGTDGRAHGSVRIEEAVNLDWEDLASFEHDGRAWLLIGDIGDNAAIRPVVTLYVVEEPEVLRDRTQSVAVARRIRFRYPGGSRDAESLAVDADNGVALVLSKRDIPAVLYSVPLWARDGEIQTATRLGVVDSIPQPSATDIERAPRALDWYWQPTAMDIAGDWLAILSYRGLYFFERAPGARWKDAVTNLPRTIDLATSGNAEAIAFGPSGRQLFVTVERRFAPLYQFNLEQ